MIRVLHPTILQSYILVSGVQNAPYTSDVRGPSRSYGCAVHPHLDSYPPNGLLHLRPRQRSLTVYRVLLLL